MLSIQCDVYWLNAVVMCVCQQRKLEMSTDQGVHVYSMPYGSEEQHGQQQADTVCETSVNSSHGQYDSC